MRVSSLLLVALLCVSCGGGNDISGPTNKIPDVTGNYRGTTTISFPEIPKTITCTTTTAVTQSGSTVNIAPLFLTGNADCTGLGSLPVGSGPIDATGNLGTETGTTSGGSCGTYTYTASGGFFGRDLRASLNYTSRTCFNMNVTISLSKQ